MLIFENVTTAFVNSACANCVTGKLQPVYSYIVKPKARLGRLAFLHCADTTVRSGAAISTVKGLIQTGLGCPRAVVYSKL